MKDKDEFNRALHNDIWNETVVQAVIEAKALARAAKGQQLNCYTLDICPRNGDENFNEDVLYAFIESMRPVIEKSVEKPIRFQLAVKVNPVHWTGFDILFKDGNVYMLQIDAVNDPQGLDVGIMINLADERLSNNGLFKRLQNYAVSPEDCRLTWLKFKPISDDPFEEKIQGIQYDSISCSRFALDHLFHLSTLDPFSEIQKNNSQYQTYRLLIPEIKSFDRDTMPRELAFLYRNTQSKTSFNSLPHDVKDQVINKRNETLAESEARHTVEGDKTKYNAAIQHKREKFIKSVERIVDICDFDRKIAGRNILNAIENKLFMKNLDIDESKVARVLIAEAKMVESRKGVKSIYQQVVHYWNELCISSAEHLLDYGYKPSTAIQSLLYMKNLTSRYRDQLNTSKKSVEEKDNPESNNPK